MEMTKEDEEEVDRMVNEFSDVVMDETTLDNDDLMIDEPGMDAEKIDAISQLSPATAEYDQRKIVLTSPQENMLHVEQENADVLPPEAQVSKRGASAELNKTKSSGQATRKPVHRNPIVKGASASRKMNPTRGRQSPK
ncbi:unnamed protein product, partial [Brassica oleracea var. botrytis]